MDLNNLTVKSKTITIKLRHPVTGEVLLNDGDDSEMTVTALNPQTKEYKAKLFSFSREKLGIQVDEQSEDINFEVFLEMSSDFVASICTDWNITLDGKSPKFSVSAAKKLFDKAIWIKEQVEIDLNSHEAFT
jgi:hypothetical protein